MLFSRDVLAIKEYKKLSATTPETKLVTSRLHHHHGSSIDGRSLTLIEAIERDISEVIIEAKSFFGIDKIVKASSNGSSNLVSYKFFSSICSCISYCSGSLSKRDNFSFSNVSTNILYKTVQNSDLTKFFLSVRISLFSIAFLTFSLKSDGTVFLSVRPFSTTSLLISLTLLIKESILL